jgi:hypothetical protein
LTPVTAHWPLTIAVSAPATWRAPAAPRICVAASVMWKNPLAFTCESRPPLVFTGSSPPSSIRPFSTNWPPSPFSQKP